MTTRESRILELAREAWQSGLPTEDEIDRGARRIERRLRAVARPRSFRRPMMAVAFAVALGGALAYAASGGTARWFGSAEERAQPQRLSGAVRAGESALVVPELGPKASPVEPEAKPESTGHGPEASASEHESTRTRAKHPAPAPAASWRAVDEALDARDDDKAKRALEGLAKSDDATTRAKARLGLAQLAQGRGDCTEARRIAFEVAAMRGVEMSIVKRAQAIVLECR